MSWRVKAGIYKSLSLESGKTELCARRTTHADTTELHAAVKSSGPAVDGGTHDVSEEGGDALEEL